ncbi:winged helix-turn-helix domain-containing protein [Acidicapsa dinghuensis]|uniref:Winged helix-turn-helix domain-containing protein n=1 Tax=Acidicapsa dinghuensis TaxID=2218256 RepID=A0ABW1EN44_9BACT|nr:winged helix-turn-helix domain-containing protein [Acidicapsa dinghuensis]
MPDSHYEFGCFHLIPSEQLLLRSGSPVPLAPKTFEILLTLVTQHGHLVTREVLMQKVWPDSFVEETNLTVNISLLRKILGDAADQRPWIATIPKRGYRFHDAVTVHPRNAVLDSEPAPAPPASSEIASSIEEPVHAEVTSTPDEQYASVVAAKPGPVLRNRPRYWIVAAAIVLVAGGIVAVLLFRHQQSGRLPEIRSLAVLPFESTGAGSDDQYLGIGLTDALISRLGRLSHLEVRPIGAVRDFSKGYDPTSVGRQLNVQAVLAGVVQRIGDRTHVAVHLQRVSDAKVLWADSFDEHNTSDFEIEESISQRLVDAMTLKLSQGEKQQLAKPNTPNNQAYDLYIQGRYYWNKRSVESVQKSIDLFRQATSIDPNYAAAWSGLADAWILAGSYGNSFIAPADAMPRAKEAAEKALALDDSSAEAHTSLAYIHLTWDWDMAGAEREFKRAIELNPNYVNAHHWYSHELIALGRVAESHEESESALALDPTDVVINEHMAWHHMMAREYDRSIPQANKAVELDPNFVQAHRVLALSLLYSGRENDACAEFMKGVELSHHDPVANAYLARCYALDHRPADARKILTSLEQAASERYISAAEIAAGYAALNDAEAALKWLNKACEERSGSLIYLNADRVWDPLRSNPGFQICVKRVNLPLLADESVKSK